MDTDPGRISLGMQLLIIVALTFANAFFARAEMAFVSLSKAKLKAIADDTSDGDASAEKVLLLLDEPNSYLSAIQVAITFAGFLSSAFASYNLSEPLVKLFAGFGINLNSQIAVVIVTLVLSYLTLVFGELVPKRLAMINPEQVAMKSVGVINFVRVVFKPFVLLLSVSVEGFFKLFKFEKPEDDSEYMTEEIMNILEEGQEQGEIDQTGKEMINNVFEFDDVFAYEIMTPRTDVFMADINDPISEYLDEMLEERYARVPYYDEDLDDLIGILYIKDYIIEARKQGFENVDIRSILRKPYYVPETKKINELLDEMRREKQSLAVIIDEFGGFSGIVTIEDLLEEIVGEIEDEYGDEEPLISRNEDGSYTVDGILELDAFEDETGVKLSSESENTTTVGGFIMELSGEIPDEESSPGKEFRQENICFKILSAQDRRIDKVLVTIEEAEEASQED